MATAKFNVIVKGNAETNTLLECPFCHRALLTLEEKNLPYTMTFVDLGNKPQWLLEKNPKGTVPIMEEDGKITPDSDVIVVQLEERFPSPNMKNTSEDAQKLMASSRVFPAAREFAKAHGEEEKAKEATLMAELKALNDYLEKHGPMFGGNTFTMADAGLAPKIYHVANALPALKNWSIPAEFKALHKYLEIVQQRPSWKKTDYGVPAIVAGWKKFLAGSH